MPVEKARVLFDAPVRAAAPELAGLDALAYDYIKGIQPLLDRNPTQAVHGPLAYLASPRAPTSLPQGHFWDRTLRARSGHGRGAAVLAVRSSDLLPPGVPYGHGAAAH